MLTLEQFKSVMESQGLTMITSMTSKKVYVSYADGQQVRHEDCLLTTHTPLERSGAYCVGHATQCLVGQMTRQHSSYVLLLI